MTKVMIDGIEYVPKTEVPPLNDERLQRCLETLTEMRHLNQHHKMSSLAWNAINALSPELSKLSASAAFRLIHDNAQIDK